MKTIAKNYHEVEIRVSFLLEEERAHRVREAHHDSPLAEPDLPIEDFLGSLAMAALNRDFLGHITEQVVEVDGKLVVWHEGYEEEDPGMAPGGPGPRS